MRITRRIEMTFAAMLELFVDTMARIEYFGRSIDSALLALTRWVLQEKSD